MSRKKAVVLKDPGKTPINEMLADLELFTKNLVKSKRKTLEFLVEANIISAEDAQERLKKTIKKTKTNE